MFEKTDRELFNRIAKYYSKKDLFPISRAARIFQLDSLMNLIEKTKFEHILDIGCGPGYNSDYLKGRFVKYTGVDYSIEFIKTARVLHQKVKFIEGNIKNLDFLNIEKFDLILGVGVLHHIDNIDEALCSIKRICNAKTTLAFIEPSNGNPFIQFLRYIRKIFDHSYSEHQIFYSKKNLEYIFKKNGFKINSFKYQGYFSTPFAQVILKPIFLFKPICALAIIVDKFIQKRLNNPFAWNLICTAKKESD